MGWIGWTGDVTIGAYDPRLGLVSEHVVAHIYHDDHSDPSLPASPTAPGGPRAS